MVTPSLVAVVDGSTAKPWDDDRVSGADLAVIVAQTLTTIRDADSIGDFIQRVNSAIGERLSPDTPSERRPCATMAAVCLSRGEVWRVGDPWIMLDGLVHNSNRALEASIAKVRARILRSKLDLGGSLEELQDSDPGREAVLPLLRGAVGKRNDPDGNGFGGIDGTSIPESYLEVAQFSGVTHEVVLATDGYLTPLSTLSEAEETLQARLDRDPLMIDDPAATKGVQPGCRSFDDRSYVRVRLERVVR